MNPGRAVLKKNQTSSNQEKSCGAEFAPMLRTAATFNPSIPIARRHDASFTQLFSAGSFVPQINLLFADGDPQRAHTHTNFITSCDK